jgi:predicted Zn finger-like uncharacterized protein
MKITCQSCQSKYTVSDDKVQGKTVKIKCRKCGSTIVVSSNGVTTTNGAGPGGDAGQATSAGTFLVNVAEGDQRSMTLQEVVDAYNSSVVTPDTYVWADGMADWAPLGQVEAITSALNAPGGGAQESMAAAAPRVAARRDPGRHAQDLFTGGGMEAQQQPAADDIATSAPLFAKGGAAAKPKGEENSMLFSLSALTAKAAPAASSGFSAKAPAANNEDSGIIDLKALAAAADARSKSHAMPSGPPPSTGFGGLMPDDGGLFLAPPVLSAAPAAPAVVSPIEAPPKNRTPLFIGIGATVAVAAIVGAFMVMKGGGEPPPTAATENTAPAVPTPAPVEPPPVPSAEASAAPTASASASAVAAKGTFKPSGGGTKPAGATTKPTGGTPPAGGGNTPAAPAAPKKGNCGCAPSDLMCAMKCAAK